MGMNDADITKLLTRLTKVVATKEDLKELATKEELKGLATKEDLKRLEVKLEKKIDNLDKKTDTILHFVEAVDETVDDHEKRLKKIESIAAIAHKINK